MTGDLRRLRRDILAVRLFRFTRLVPTIPSDLRTVTTFSAADCQSRALAFGRRHYVVDSHPASSLASRLLARLMDSKTIKDALHWLEHRGAKEFL